MPQARAQGNYQLQGAGNAQHHADAAAVELAAGAIARVFQRHLGGQQAQQLGAVGGFGAGGSFTRSGRLLEALTAP